jgi:predicted nucleotidyltransferase
MTAEIPTPLKEYLMNTFNLPTDKIPDHLRQIVIAIQEILGKKAYDFILIGATARDLILNGQYNLGAGRVTLDVDFALYIPEWDSYAEMINNLLASGRFSATQVMHKLLYNNYCEVDIVPFGEIQDENGAYTWPPDHIQSMNVAGFMEIREQCITFQVEGEVISINAAPIHAIYFMKILAWNDRKHKDDKDGKDQGFILSNYIELKYDVLYDQYKDIVESDDWDTITSCARMLGRDIADLLKDNGKALETTCGIIERELIDKDNSRLAKSMSVGGCFTYTKSYRGLNELLTGLKGG